MFMAKRLKVQLTQNETGEYAMVLWLDTKSEPHANGLIKQIIEMMQAMNGGATAVDAGQILKRPPLIKGPLG